jgi:DNA helicase IV
MDCRLVLYKNCRNTAEISESLRCIGKIETKGYVNDNHGNKPLVQFFAKEKKKEIIESIESFVNTSIGEGISLADIVILTVNTLKHSILTDVKSISKIPISNKQELGKVWFTTVRRFKGLEAKAVLVVDAKTSEMPKELTRRLMYVGCSRATSKLKVIIVDDVSQKKYVEFFSPLGVKIERRKDLADWLGLQLEK